MSAIKVSSFTLVLTESILLEGKGTLKLRVSRNCFAIYRFLRAGVLHLAYDMNITMETSFPGM